MSDENKTPEEQAVDTPTETPTPEASSDATIPAADNSAESDSTPTTQETKSEAPSEKKWWGRGRGWNNAQKKAFDNPLSDKPEKRWGRRWGKWWGRGWRWDKQQKEFQEILLEVRRVTRVTTGGRQLAFRAIIVIGNGKGKIGLWVAKGNDVSIAVRKATHEAYKNVVTAPITEELTVPYGITHKYKSAIIKLMPATEGTGMKAWSSVRMVLELAWYNNMLSKIVGTNNKLNNAIACIQALAKYKVGKTPPKQKTKEKSDAATKGQKDTTTWSNDLSKIEWIGPKIAEMLANNGIKTYDDLSTSKVWDLRKLLEDNKMSQHDPDTRSKQATLAKNEKRDELKKLQNELDWGKVVA